MCAYRPWGGTNTATTDILSATALIGLGGLAIAVVKLWLDLRAERQRTVTETGRVKVESEQAASVGKLAKSQAREVEELKKLVVSMANVVESYDHEVAALRREVEILRRETASGTSSRQLLAAIETQKLEQRKAEAGWRQTVDIAKGIGWFLDRKGCRRNLGHASSPSEGSRTGDGAAFGSS